MIKLRISLIQNSIKSEEDKIKLMNEILFFSHSKCFPSTFGVCTILGISAYVS